MSDEYATISEPAAQPDGVSQHGSVAETDSVTGAGQVTGPGRVEHDRVAEADHVADLDRVAEANRVKEASAIALHSSARYFVVPTVLDAARSLASILILALFVLTFIAQPFRIPSESMERTLLVGDFLLVNKMLYAPPGPWRRLLPYRDVARGDVVVFRFPLDPSDYVVKRVIGVPGDRIHLSDGVVYLNGQPQHEPYAVYEEAYRDQFRDQFPAGVFTDPGVDTHWWLEMRANLSGGDLVVPAGSYFVLGDNRNHSRDSRYWGFVPRQAILGRPFVIYFSLRRPSATDTPTLPDDKLDRIGHANDPVNGLADFARWDRMLRIVR